MTQHTVSGRHYWSLVLPFLSLMAHAADEPQTGLTTELKISAGGTYRLRDADPMQIAKTNGGSGTAINADDGDRLHAERGWVSRGLSAKLGLGYEGESLQARINGTANWDPVYNTATSPEATRNRIGRGGYVNEAWLGTRGELAGGQWQLKLGQQLLRWGESPSLENQLNIVNPIQLWKIWLPGNQADDARTALSMATLNWKSASGMEAGLVLPLQQRYSEPNPNGSFFSGNDYYSPGSRVFYLSPNVSDNGQSVVTPSTPFGSAIARSPDRHDNPREWGLSLRSPEFGGDWKARVSLYAGHFLSRELTVGETLGKVSDLQGVTAPNYAAGTRYFLEYANGGNMLGASAKFMPTASTQVRLDYSTRFKAPLQIDDQTLVTAGIAPAAVVATCLAGGAASLNSPQCAGTLKSLNANPLVARMGGITPANAMSWFGRDIHGYERHDLSQLTIGLSQGLPNVAGSSLILLNLEYNGQYVGGYDSKAMPIDAVVSSNGTAPNGIATAYSWGWKLGAKADWTQLASLDKLSVFAQYAKEQHGYSPFPRSLILQGRSWLQTGTQLGFNRHWNAQLMLQAQLNHGDAADTENDKRFVSAWLSYTY